MLLITDALFDQLIDEAMQTLPKEHIRHLQNVAFVSQEYPTPAQRKSLALRNDQTLFGLYEGVPLSQRQGMQRMLPDKITLFKGPLCAGVSTERELAEQIRHTLWHEIAHYYGLDHTQIHELEGPLRS